LARRLASGEGNYFDLEDTVQRVALEDNASSILRGLSGWVVIDEIQELPELFRLLRVLADREPLPARFIVLGSVSLDILTGISESLAGRVAVLEMGGFDLEEVGAADWRALWLRGGFPRSYLAADDPASFEWRENYLDQLIGRDLRIWSGLRLKPGMARRLLLLVADASGKAWNHSSAAQDLGVDPKTVQRYVEVIEGAFLLRRLPVFEANTRKRLRKAPTLHFRDTGLLHTILGIPSMARLEAGPRRGRSRESFCIDQVIRLTQTRSEYCFTWSVQGGPEVDLILDRPNGRWGFEVKAKDAPKVGSEFRALREELGLECLFIVRPGADELDLGDGVVSLGIERLPWVAERIREREPSA
jgi:predicted AAA+ superfamily ATPase